jgi:hypothetical protein
MLVHKLDNKTKRSYSCKVREDDCIREECETRGSYRLLGEISCLDILKKDAETYFETSVTIYHSTQWHIPGRRNTNHLEKLKSVSFDCINSNLPYYEICAVLECYSALIGK